ncbi:hypothetical protein [Yersinia phage vB_YenM_P778]
MKIGELVEWLKTFPQDADVLVLSHDDSHSCVYTQGGTTETVEFILEDSEPFKGDKTWEYNEYTRETFKPCSFYGKKELILGRTI